LECMVNWGEKYAVAQQTAATQVSASLA